MDRRTFIGTIGGALAMAGAARAQQSGRVFRLGWLEHNVGNVNRSLGDAFTAGMRERGWIEGQNFTVESLYSEGDSERFPALAAALVQRKVDLIVAAGTVSAIAARNATSTIPIVFYFVGDPIGSGLVASLARPGGNITGLGGIGPGVHAKHVELLKEAVPAATRIAMLTNSAFPLHKIYRAEVEPTARRLGMTVTPVEVRVPEEIDGAFATIEREKVDGLLMLGQPILFGAREQIARLALKQRLPAVVVFGEIAQAGILMSYGARVIDDFRRLPYYIDSILKGAKPGQLPVEQPTRFYLTVNLKTAKAIGLTIPQPLLQRADEVIQ